MHHLFALLTKASDETEIIFFSLLLIVGWNIENLAGLATGYKKWKHAYVNAKFLITGIIPQVITGFFFVKMMQWTSIHHFGILYYMPFKNYPAVQFIMSFILLDFGEYVYHVIMHKINGLWKFHAVHHCDNIVDVSTTLREHPCENFIRNTFTLIWIFFSGALFWTLFLRQIIQMFSNTLVHMNYRLPEKLDAVVGWVFITPNLHQVHHHYRKPYTDSNYGDVLSIWDRLFGTLNRLPHEEIIFGVETHMDNNINSKYISLLKMPFVKADKRQKST